MKHRYILSILFSGLCLFNAASADINENNSIQVEELKKLASTENDLLFKIWEKSDKMVAIPISIKYNYAENAMLEEQFILNFKREQLYAERERLYAKLQETKQKRFLMFSKIQKEIVNSNKVTKVVYANTDIEVGNESIFGNITYSSDENVDYVFDLSGAKFNKLTLKNKSKNTNLVFNKEVILEKLEAKSLILENIEFKDTFNISNAKIKNKLNIRNTIFEKEVSFKNITTRDNITLENSTFEEKVSFENARFLPGSWFSKTVVFDNVIFNKEVNFNNAKFVQVQKKIIGCLTVSFVLKNVYFINGYTKENVELPVNGIFYALNSAKEGNVLITEF